jgi:hypothetical protein
MKTVKNTLFVAMLAIASVSVAIDTTDIVSAIDAMHAPVQKVVAPKAAQTWFEYAKSLVPTMPTFADVQTRAQAAYTNSKDAVLALPGQASVAAQKSVEFVKANPVLTAAITAGVVTTGAAIYFRNDIYNAIFGSEVQKSEKTVRSTDVQASKRVGATAKGQAKGLSTAKAA